MAPAARSVFVRHGARAHSNALHPDYCSRQ